MTLNPSNRIENITKEQEARLDAIRKDYLRKFHNHEIPFNLERSTRLINRIYELAELPPNPTIYVEPSPDACQRRANQLMGTENQFYNFGWDIQCNDASWVLFYKFFHDEGQIHHPIFLELADDFLNHGIFASVQFDEAIIFCKPPVALHVDSNNDLHAEDCPAIEFEDGFKVYFWHSRYVPEKLIMTPNEITREDFLSVDNAELKRCYMEKLGMARVAELLEPQVIDEGIDKHGNPISLVRTKQPVHENVYAFFVNVVCPSTGRKYMLGVPSTVKTAKEGVAWTFFETEETYNPEIEA